MYPSEFEYYAPETVEDVVRLLEQFGEDAKILAGGQSLIPMMKLRIASPRHLIDVNRVSSLNGFTQSGDQLVLGALCRHAEIAASPLVKARLPLMMDAAHLTADVQVRNRGTVAGSLAHADPSGDWPTALLALDTHVEIRGLTGSRTVRLDEFFVDAYTTQLGPTEMLTKVSVSIPAQRSGGAYVKFERRAGDFAVASVGVQLELEDDRHCRTIAISLGALGPVPMRARAAEEIVQGKTPSTDLLAEAADLIQQAAEPFADTRGSVQYKRHLAGVLFRRAFTVAWDRAHGADRATLRV